VEQGVDFENDEQENEDDVEEGCEQEEVVHRPILL
jgi:hypothetical protein